MAVGTVSTSILTDIASAIRGQNGLSTLYQPGDMAAAILALVWDVGFKIRALLLDDGTLEINYYERRKSVIDGRIVRVFEIDPAGYSSASARSYDSIKLLVGKVYIDSTIAGLGIQNCNYWFNAFANCTEIRGFENLSGIDERQPDVLQLREPGDHLRHELQQLGALGLAHVQQLQPPPGGQDGRLRALYDERSERVQAGRGRRADRSQRRSAHVFLGVLLRRRRGRAHGELNAGLDARARDIEQDLRHRQVRGAGLHALGRRHRADAPPAPHQRDFRCGHGHILVPEPELPVLLVHESGQRERAGQPLRRALDALHVQLLRVHDHRLPGLRPIDAHGPVLHVLGCNKLTTIYANSTWALPSSGITGSQCFYSCSTSLVGGNGTVWASNKTAYTYFRIDAAATPGYVTAA